MSLAAASPCRAAAAILSVSHGTSCARRGPVVPACQRTLAILTTAVPTGTDRPRRSSPSSPSTSSVESCDAPSAAAEGATPPAASRRVWRRAESDCERPAVCRASLSGSISGTCTIRGRVSRKSTDTSSAPLPRRRSRGAAGGCSSGGTTPAPPPPPPLSPPPTELVERAKDVEAAVARAAERLPVARPVGLVRVERVVDRRRDAQLDDLVELRRGERRAAEARRAGAVRAVRAAVHQAKPHRQLGRRRRAVRLCVAVEEEEEALALPGAPVAEAHLALPQPALVAPLGRRRRRAPAASSAAA